MSDRPGPTPPPLLPLLPLRGLPPGGRRQLQPMFAACPLAPRREPYHFVRLTFLLSVHAPQHQPPRRAACAGAGGGARALPPDEAPLSAASVHSAYLTGRVPWNTVMQPWAALARAGFDSPRTAAPPRQHVRRTPDHAAKRPPPGKATVGARTWPTPAPPKGGRRRLHPVCRSTLSCRHSAVLAVATAVGMNQHCTTVTRVRYVYVAYGIAYGFVYV